MARYTLLFILAVALVALALLIAGQAGLLRGKAPPDLGAKDGKLKRISRTENSASSQADLWVDHPMQAYARVDAFPITGDGSAQMAKLASLLQAMPRTQVITQEAGYIYAQCTTQVLKFTDDVELLLDASAGVIHVRSASRVGSKDFGVNRARVEALRQGLAQN